MPAIRSTTALCLHGLLFVAMLQLSMTRKFEGRIQATITLRGIMETFLHTIGTNRMRLVLVLLC